LRLFRQLAWCDDLVGRHVPLPSAARCSSFLSLSSVLEMFRPSRAFRDRCLAPPVVIAPPHFAGRLRSCLLEPFRHRPSGGTPFFSSEHHRNPSAIIAGRTSCLSPLPRTSFFSAPICFFAGQESLVGFLIFAGCVFPPPFRFASPESFRQPQAVFFLSLNHMHADSNPNDSRTYCLVARLFSPFLPFRRAFRLRI